MQQLTLVPRLMPAVRCGEKTSTIRWLEGDITIGPLRLVNQQDENDAVIVSVTQVDTLRLSEVAAMLGKQEEWPDEVLLEGMREHYPEIRLSSEVQLITHLTPAETLQKLPE
ncbi:ASCH domain-containing protein [Pantoea vagans]|uniref:ASCH domain-containing protein n=1 Tax=Pantoea TaxID=53335 RepID=UPI0013784E14|nr:MULTISPECIES: ASCH domain-containing protein [Pantoea]NBB56845.1 ASCH domain-containing protein [Pantoea vagans]QZX97538.1 ASCH domain-containing protein [Pantoea alfalfae]